MTGGRPLRFLALALGGWVVVRIAVLLPEIRALPVSAAIPRLIAALVPAVTATGFGRPRPAGPSSDPKLIPGPDSHPVTPPPTPAVREDLPIRSPRPMSSIIHDNPLVGLVQGIDRVPTPFAPPATVSTRARLSGSAWLLIRGGPAGTVSGGQLGASQGGMRVTYALDRRHRLALAARLAAPLSGTGREAALGIEWQPTDWPIRLIAEQRFVLDGGGGGATVGVIAGYGPADIIRGVRLEAYGQAGSIARDGLEGFVDASARVTHPLGRIGEARMDIGIGAWGSAQRAAARFDIGPSVVATLPVAGKSIRVALDWRERVAGAARPGSGPALSIGSDF